MEMKAQGEWIRKKYQVLNAFPFVIGTLYFTELQNKQGIRQTRFIHALDVRAVSEQIQKEPVLSRDDSVFFPVREVFIEDGMMYQVFHRLEGILLAHHLQQKTPLPLTEMTWIVRAITRHLLRLYADRQFTLVHPQNIVLTNGKGIRFLYGGPIGTLPKGVGTDRGSIEELMKLNYLYDSYTIGAMIYQMLTGKNPLTTGLRIPPLTDGCPECPPELEELVLRSLSFDMNKRPKIEEFADYLDWLVERLD